jgi:predicted aspartyl protease
VRGGVGVRGGFAGLIAIVLTASPALAQMYRWTDERGQAHYSQGIDSVPQRFRAGATALPYRETPTASAPAPVAATSPPADGITVIEFASGKPIYVTARINDRENARLILDTGADRTVIAPRALIAAGVSMRRAGAPGRILGATGTADVEGFRVESIEVGNARVGRMLVVSHDVNLPDSDGLLGRDFLNHFKVTIDNATNKVTLAPR